MAKRYKYELTTFSKVLIFIVVVVLVGFLGYILIGNYEECDSRDCFNTNLFECKETTFIGGTNEIYEYVIFDKTKETCEVLVTLLQGELNNQNSIKLEGKEMTCSLPLGVVMNPESDIGNCHGQLKEGLQDLIIQKLHSYIAQNIGRINLEVLDSPASNELVSDEVVDNSSSGFNNTMENSNISQENQAMIDELFG